LRDIEGGQPCETAFADEARRFDAGARRQKLIAVWVD
jgi:hypothetical protein